jgi:tRNA dimethylallyltransferase
MSKKIISIVGPTATGKTKFALQMVVELGQKPALDPKKEFTGFDLISADSRQIYKSIAIISGADVPADFKLDTVDGLPYSVYQKKISAEGDNTINLHGVGILEKNQEWSVAHFVNFAREVINWSWKNDRLPIVVGGTGLYHKHLFDPAMTINVPPNEKLRAELEKLNLEELQLKLQDLDLEKWQQMNHSDQNNLRRLVRAIEVKLSDEVHYLAEFTDEFEVSKLGLKAELSQLEEKIKKRVRERFENGAILEVEKLGLGETLEETEVVSKQLLSATGVNEILELNEGKISVEECLSRWGFARVSVCQKAVNLV